MRINMTTAACFAAAMLGTSLTTAEAQGLSYDILTTGTGRGRGGETQTRTFMAAHGQFSNGTSRLDITESMSPAGGLMGAGTYMIMNTGKGTTTIVDPAKREYMELNPSEMAKSAAGLQQAVGGMVKTELSGVRVGVEDLGAGESIEGYPTIKYRVTDDYTMKMTIMGRTTQSVQHSTTDLWVSPKLDGIMNPMARPAASATTGPMADLTAEMVKAYAKVRPGVMLKSIRTSETVTDGKTNTSTMSTTLSNVKRATISPSVFEVPADYTKAASPMDALAPLGAAVDSLKKAAGSRRTRRPTRRDRAVRFPRLVQAADSAKAGVKEGVVEGAKEQAKDDAKAQTKKTLGRIFRRPMQ